MNTSLDRLLNGQRVSRETMEKLDHFSRLFHKWSRSINLVAPSTTGDLWHRHIADSAQIYQLLPGPRRWLDLGSGGGFPGVITAILMSETREGWVHLVESNNKKAAFLRTALNEVGARGSVHPVRIEEAKSVIPHCDAISARALADLSQLFDYFLPWMTGPQHAFLHKGRDYQIELDKAVGRFRFDLVKHVSAIEEDSVILEISSLFRKS